MGVLPQLAKATATAKAKENAENAAAQRNAAKDKSKYRGPSTALGMTDVGWGGNLKSKSKGKLTGYRWHGKAFLWC
jgi:hypothetical protein